MKINTLIARNDSQNQFQTQSLVTFSLYIFALKFGNAMKHFCLDWTSFIILTCLILNSCKHFIFKLLTGEWCTSLSCCIISIVKWLIHMKMLVFPFLLIYSDIIAFRTRSWLQNEHQEWLNSEYKWNTWPGSRGRH